MQIKKNMRDIQIGRWELGIKYSMNFEFYNIIVKHKLEKFGRERFIYPIISVLDIFIILYNINIYIYIV